MSDTPNLFGGDNALMLNEADAARVSFAHWVGQVEASGEPEKHVALPLSTDVTSLQLQLREAIEMAVRDRMLVKELAAALKEASILLNAVAPVMARKGTLVYGIGAQQVDAALAKVPQ